MSLPVLNRFQNEKQHFEFVILYQEGLARNKTIGSMSLCVWVKPYFPVSLYPTKKNTPKTIFQIVTLFHVLLPRKQQPNLFPESTDTGAINVRYLKTEFVTSGHGFPVHSWIAALETACCMYIYFLVLI